MDMSIVYPKIITIPLNQNQPPVNAPQQPFPKKLHFPTNLQSKNKMDFSTQFLLQHSHSLYSLYSFFYFNFQTTADRESENKKNI